MKIVIASRSTLGHHLGGMETYVDQQAKELRDLGHEVVLLTSPRVSDDYLMRLNADGIRVSYVERGDALRYSANWHIRIQKTVDELNPDVVIFHGVAGCSYVPIGRAPAITLTHGSAPISMYNTTRGRRPLRGIASRILSFLRYKESYNLRHHTLVALSDFDAKLTAIATLQPRSNISVIPPAIYPGRHDSKRENIIVYAGRIEAVKGIDVILSSWRKIDCKGHQLVVAGDGSQLARLRDVFEGCKDVSFLGALSRTEVAVLLGRARWSVSGGRFMESFGLSVAESLASGTPVVYPRRGALPETAGAAGISYKSEGELCVALQSAVNISETDWGALNCQALERAGDFSPERSRFRWERLLAKVTE